MIDSRADRAADIAAMVVPKPGEGALPRQFEGVNRDSLGLARRAAQRCAGTACGIALLALAGWLVDARFLAGQWGGAMADSSSMRAGPRAG